MLVWQIGDGYFHSIDLHDHSSVLWVQVNITSAEIKRLCQLVDENNYFFLVFNGHSHVSNFHIDMVLLNVILLQENHEFQLISAILCQNLVARQWHLVLVSSVVECGQCVSVEATLYCEEKQSFIPLHTAKDNFQCIKQ